VRQAARRLVDASHEQASRSQVMLTLADAFACEGEALWSAVQSAVPPHWRIFGGTAGDDWRFKQSHVFAGREILRDAAVLVGLFTDARASLVTHHGWYVVEGAREMTITAIDGHLVRKIDGKPALEVYRAELVRLGLLRDGEELVPTGALHELGARTPYGNELKIRAPIGVREDGAIVLAGGLPVGTAVQVVTSSPERLIESAKTISTRVLEPFESAAVRGAMVFDCGARMRLLGDRYGAEVAAFQGGRRFPMVGTTCYGEIAKFAGSVDGFHNATAVMAAW
jgi:hypothetical protein